MRRFYTPPAQVSDQSIRLGIEETRHLRDVLRLREGAEINVFDGEGREFLCTIAIIDKKSSSAVIKAEIDPVSPESNLELVLAVGLLKGEKFDIVVQKAVELGVSRIQPLYTKRSDVKFAVKDGKTERWRKIALEAAKQSGRAKLMKIESPVDFGDFVQTFQALSADDEGRILFTECAGTGFESGRKFKKMTALIGPEGGWETSELDSASTRGFELITLGGRILRAETAVITVAAILQHRFGDLV